MSYLDRRQAAFGLHRLAMGRVRLADRMWLYWKAGAEARERRWRDMFIVNFAQPAQLRRSDTNGG
jgi:hypothetical protein